MKAPAKQNLKRATAAAKAAAPDRAAFNEAVEEARKIVQQLRKDQLRLGELADKVETTYGNGDLGKFAAQIGEVKCTIERYRDVYRAWKDQIPALRRETKYAKTKYTVLRELQAHPDRFALVDEKPDMKPGEARKLMKEYKEENAPVVNDQHRKWARDCKKVGKQLRALNDYAAGVPDEELQAFFEPTFLNDIAAACEAMAKRMRGGMSADVEAAEAAEGDLAKAA
jgi:hypothetical protein